MSAGRPVIGQRASPQLTQEIDEHAAGVAAVVLAGGRGSRLGALTKRICKPALPFGGGLRCIDFTLSNCANSGIRHVGVVVQHRPDTLLSHVDRVWGDTGVEAWSPAKSERPYTGTIDAVLRNLDRTSRSTTDQILVLAGDHVYKMDYRPMLALHRARGADVSIASIEVAASECHHFGVVRTASDDRVTDFVEKPLYPHRLVSSTSGRVLASMGVYVFERRFLAALLRNAAQATSSDGDIGRDLLPAAVASAQVYAHRFGGHGDAPGGPYWRDIGTPTAYWRANMDSLGPAPTVRLDDPCWPLRTDSGLGTIQRPADARPRSDRDLLIPLGSAVTGASIRRSVLFRGVAIGSGTLIVDSVVLPGARVGRGCRLRGVVIAFDASVADGEEIDAFTAVSDGAAFSPVIVDEDAPRPARARGREVAPNSAVQIQ